MGDAFINPSKEENEDLQTVGFVQAIRDTRYFGDTHSKGRRAHVQPRRPARLTGRRQEI